ncbi:hypothetical protein [uncultured Jannaschia sp.]|uniref:hypothetical protein n=1 Tax=uncultured Jannaschia sp. TaxID=293347 RepID=UPI002633D795|nr:hypothetical protein [uncultured Jannaschia sp.]
MTTRSRTDGRSLTEILASAALAVFNILLFVYFVQARMLDNRYDDVVTILVLVTGGINLILAFGVGVEAYRTHRASKRRSKASAASATR